MKALRALGLLTCLSTISKVLIVLKDFKSILWPFATTARKICMMSQGWM